MSQLRIKPPKKVSVMYHHIANFNMLHSDVHVPSSLITTASGHKINKKCEAQTPGMKVYDTELQQHLNSLSVLF